MEKFRQFKKGLCCLRGGILLGGLSVFLVILFGLERLMSIGVYGLISKKFLLLGESDFMTNLKVDLARQKWKSGFTSLYLIGGSSIRECVNDAESLRKRVGFDGEAVYLGTTGLTLGEALAIVDLLPQGNRNRRGFILQGLMFGQLDDSRAKYQKKWERGRVPFPSQAMARFLENEGINNLRSPLFWLPYLNSFVRSNWRNLVRGQLPGREINFHPVDKKKSLSELSAKWEGMKERKDVIFHQRYAFNLRALGQTIEIARAKGLEYIVVDTPLSPLARRIFGKTLSAYRGVVGQFLSETKVPYWDFAWSLGLKEDEFIDGSHLLPSGREKFETRLAEYILNHLQMSSRQSHST